jgi:hypothetical protein
MTGSRVFASVKGVGKCIIFCIENVKVIILKDEALLFSTETTLSKLFVKTIQSEFENFSTLRFEHEVIETLLNVVFIWLSMEFNELDKHLQETRLYQQQETSEIEFVKRQLEMFPKKTQLQLLRKRVIEITRELSDLQSDDSHLSKLVIVDGGPAASGPQAGKRGTLHSGQYEQGAMNESAAMAPKRSTALLESSPHVGLQGMVSDVVARAPKRGTALIEAALGVKDESAPGLAGNTSLHDGTATDGVDNNRISIDIGCAKQSVPFAHMSAHPPNVPHQYQHHAHTPSPEYSGNSIRVQSPTTKHTAVNSSNHGFDGLPNLAHAAEVAMREQSISMARRSAAGGDEMRPSISMRSPAARMNPVSGGLGAGFARQRRKQSLQFGLGNRPTKDLTFDVELILDNSIIRMCYLENEVDDLIERISAHEGLFLLHRMCVCQ